MSEKCLFPDLMESERSTLYIVGNGFDLFHGIRSSYHDFYNWLKSNGKDDFIAGLEKIYPQKLGDRYLLWSDFEGAIGKYDIPSIFKTFAGDIDTYDDEQVGEIGCKKVAPYINGILPNILHWAEELDVLGVKQLLTLPKESLFLSFNYTRILEDVYHIPASQICHIHGSVKGEGKLVAGHDNYFDKNDIDNASFPGYEEKGMMDIADCMNSLWKNPEERIKKYDDFFMKTVGIGRVVVLGHSLATIDKRYFGEIANRADCHCHWHFSKHSPDDENNISAMIEILNIQNNNRWIFNC